MTEPLNSMAPVAHPEILDLELSAHRQRFDEIRRRFKDTLHEHDTILDQLRDLAKILHPRSELVGRELDIAVEPLLGGQPLDIFGRWVFYPWNRSLVHLLPPDQFRQVRHNRNLYKITA